MSIYSDYKCGAISEQEFRDCGIRENRRERQWLDEWERLCEEGDDEIQDTDDEQ